jgi:two-component system sensor histidine kinase TctE
VKPNPKPPSLRRRLLWWLLPPLVALLLVNGYLAYQGALAAVNRAYDRSLTASIKSISEGTHSLNGEISVSIPDAAFDFFEGGAQERVFYAVIGLGRRVITGYADLPIPATLDDDGKVVIANAVYHGEPIRIAAFRKRLYDPALGAGDSVLIAFAETTESRTDLARELFVDSLRRQLLLVAVGAILVALALSSAFRPLLSLRDRVRARTDDDLTPIPDHDVPSEVRPLTDAINHHIARLSALIQARKRFLADAAHQIRTPLAVLGTQAEYGSRQDDPAEMRRSFAGLIRTIGSTQRLANQMLALSQAEAINGLMLERSPVDVAALAHDIALELSPLAVRKNVDLGFDGSGAPAPVLGNASMLHEMLGNLIDNAIRYTPAGGQVTVGVAVEGGEAVIRVGDDGPGIPPAEREKVFLRFYRILGQGDSEGSGLGLPIVKEICAAHGGRIELRDGPSGKGLAVEVRLPVQAQG